MNIFALLCMYTYCNQGHFIFIYSCPVHVHVHSAYTDYDNNSGIPMAFAGSWNLI